MKLVNRFDLARISGKVKRTPQGFLRIPATLTRAGVFEYRRQDGSTIKELRPEDEVFKQDSMESLAGAPVTLKHPVEDGALVIVTSENAKKFLVGYTGDQVVREDNLISGTVTVTDAPVVEQIEARLLKDVSCGYQCVIDSTPGEHPEFGRYDQVQRGIKYNHVALGGPAWGRAGADVGLRLDSADAIQVDDIQPATGRAGRKRMETITINGVEFEVPKAAAQAIRAEQARRDSALVDVTKERDNLQGRFDAQKVKLEATETALKEAQDPSRFDSAVQDRIVLIDQARKVLGVDASISGSTREVQEAVLRHDNKDLDLTGKSDDYVQARFDARMDLVTSAGETDIAATRVAASVAASVERYDSGKARQRMIEENRKAASAPLAVSKSNVQ